MKCARSLIRSVFDRYVGQTMEAEIRHYADHSGGSQIYVHTNLGDWLAIISMKYGIVFCDGLIAVNDDKYWPQGEYRVIGSFESKIEPAHKPVYGTSPHKDRMSEAVETSAILICEDLNRGSGVEDWSDAEVYIADFLNMRMEQPCGSSDRMDMRGIPLFTLSKNPVM